MLIQTFCRQPLPFVDLRLYESKPSEPKEAPRWGEAVLSASVRRKERIESREALKYSPAPFCVAGAAASLTKRAGGRAASGDAA